MSDDSHTDTGEPTADDHLTGELADGGETALDGVTATTDGVDATDATDVADSTDVTDGVGEAAFDSAGEAGPQETADPGVVVPKATYCESCEHFADPPDVACTHEGTRIAELVDREHFRVVDCPVVVEREALGDH